MPWTKTTPRTVVTTSVELRDKLSTQPWAEVMINGVLLARVCPTCAALVVDDKRQWHIDWHAAVLEMVGR